MLKTLFSNVLIDIKVFYRNIFLVCLPFFALAALISIPVYQNIEMINQNRFYLSGFALVNSLIYGTACVIGLYYFQELIQGHYSFKNLAGKVKKDLVLIAKVILKKAVLLQLAFYLFYIPGIFFFIRWYLVYPCFVFEKSAKPFDRSIELTKKNWLFIFLLFLFFSFQVMGAVFLGAIVRLIYNVSIPNGFFPAAADYTRVAVGLGMILFVLLITPVIIMFDYEFYRYCLENYKKDIAGTPGFKWGKGFLKP